MRDGVPDKAALNRFGAKWRVEFSGAAAGPRRSADDVSLRAQALIRLSTSEIADRSEAGAVAAT